MANRIEVEEMKRAGSLHIDQEAAPSTPARPQAQPQSRGGNVDVTQLHGAEKKKGLGERAGAAVGKAIGNFFKSMADPKQYATLGAEFRRGLKDLQEAVLNPFPQAYAAQHEEPGTIANPTQMQVTKEIEPTLYRPMEPNRSDDKSHGR